MQPSTIERDCAWSASLVASSPCPLAAIGSRAGVHVDRTRALLPRCRTCASEGRAAAFLFRSFPHEREPRSPSQRRLCQFKSVSRPKGVQSTPVFSCKQQKKNRGSKRNAKTINGKSRRRHEKNRQ